MTSTNRHLTAAGVAVGVVGLLLTVFAGPWGCSQKCRDLRDDYQQALTGDPAFGADPLPDGGDKREGDDTVHLVGAVSVPFLNRAADRAVTDAIEGVLETTRSLEVGGQQPVDIHVDPGLADLQVAPAADVCAHCFQVRASLDGTAGVDIPVLGRRDATLDADLELVVPLTLGPHEDGGTLKLGFGQLIRQGKPLIIDGLEGIPSTWAQVLQTGLESALTDLLLEQLPPVTVARLKTPDFGLDGFKFAPVGLHVDPDRRRIVAGFRTNLPIPGTSIETLTHGLPSAGMAAPDGKETDEKETDGRQTDGDGTGGPDVAFAVDTNLVAAAVRAGLRTESIPRRYDSGGTSDENGELRVIPEQLVVDPDRKTADDDSVDTLPFEFTFRLWRLPDRGACRSFDGVAGGYLSAQDAELEVDIDDLTFKNTGDSKPGLAMANWRSNRMLGEGKRVLRESLSEQNLDAPGGPWTFTDVAFRAREGVAGAGFRLVSEDGS